MSKFTIRLTSTSRTGTETAIADVLSCEEPEGLSEMVVAMINEIKSMNKERNEDRKELKTFRKECGGVRGARGIRYAFTSSAGYQIRIAICAIPERTRK